MKGIIGRERAKTYTPSAYGGGDEGGAAGGFGLPHGLDVGGYNGLGGEGSGEEPAPEPSYGYAGSPLCFEGGVRAGGVSEHETMPAQYPYSKKIGGYDETSPSRPGGRRMGGGTIHEKPGVEGMRMTSPMEAPAAPKEDHGYGCPHGCGMNTRSKHGLARHIKSRHGGFGGLGHALNHGTSYKPGEEFRGETEGPKEWEANEHEWDHAAKMAKQGPDASSAKGSSY